MNRHQSTLKNELKQRLDSLTQENLTMKEQINTEPNVLPDLADRASSESSKELIIARHRRNLEAIEEIQESLAQIEAGSYGICELCGEEIAPKRLMALPSTKFCVRCQSVLDGDNRLPLAS
ncbi:MAG TPA: TraR/DksA C4-type zinc finger protein [Desulfomicrobiaceae bacterium]|nr:TraR/DksA C4-type zinc finger protein [Desulfomicrobiaceae bacterium]